MPDTMKAVVIYEPGGPEVLKVEQRPVPQPRAGEVLIRVEAFGLNRSELFRAKVTRPPSRSRACSGSRRWAPSPLLPVASSNPARRSRR